MGLKEKLLKNSTIQETALLELSELWKPRDMISTNVPALNIALSGSINGGFGPGLLQIAGKSKRFKSKFSLEILKAFQKKFSEGIALVYDSEFGTPKSYFEELNTDNIVHSPIVNLEQLTHDIAVQFNGVEPKDDDRLFVILDSLGNVPSIKEAQDAINKPDIPTDMTRAKAIKSLFRIIGPQLVVKNIYMVAINHTYDTLELYSKEIVGGGTGSIFNSNGIWIISSEKNKDSKKELLGFDFKIKIEKSRFVKEDKKIPITVSFDEGIHKWSGLLEIGVESGYVIRPNAQKYALKHIPDKEYSLKQLEHCDEFFNELLNNTDFGKYVEEEFQI